MKVKNFLKMHKGGVACVSIHPKPYDYGNHRYIQTYFEEEDQDVLVESENFKSIANMQVDHFSIIGGTYEKVELCVYLKERCNSN